MKFAHWQPPQKRAIPKALWPWLTEQGSLTRRLQAHSQAGFSVQVLATGWQKADRDEARRLDSDSQQQHFCREVLLMDGAQPRVFARTVVPLDSYQALQPRLTGLGNHSLGAMLFKDPSVSRDAIEVRCLTADSLLYQRAQAGAGLDVDQVWARRSCFSLKGHILLVSEVFLPGEPACPW